MAASLLPAGLPSALLAPGRRNPTRDAPRFTQGHRCAHAGPSSVRTTAHRGPIDPPIATWHAPRADRPTIPARRARAGGRRRRPRPSGPDRKPVGITAATGEVGSTSPDPSGDREGWGNCHQNESGRPGRTHRLNRRFHGDTAAALLVGVPVPSRFGSSVGGW